MADAAAPPAPSADPAPAKDVPKEGLGGGPRGFGSRASTPEVSNSIDANKPGSTAADGSQCELRFLMVNGESFRMVVPAAFSVQQVKQKVIDERPTELVEFLRESKPSVLSGPSKIDEIRVLHLGKFLEDAKTLKECNFATGADNLTTVHIWVRVPASASEDVKEKVNKKGSACCAVM